MLMVMYMMVCGKMIKLMVKEFIAIQMVQNTKATGQKINNMVKELKLGQMEQNMKETTFMEKSMVMEDSHGQMGVHIQDNLKNIEMSDPLNLIHQHMFPLTDNPHRKIW